MNNLWRSPLEMCPQLWSQKYTDCFWNVVFHKWLGVSILNFFSVILENRGMDALFSFTHIISLRVFSVLDKVLCFYIIPLQNQINHSCFEATSDNLSLFLVYSFLSLA